MEKDKIISHIVSGRNIPDSEEFREWMESSEENRKEFIRYKNTWALLQRGGGMDAQQIAEGYQKVKHRLDKSGKFMWIHTFIRYAAVIVVAMATGYMFHSLTQSREISMNEIAVPHGNRSLVTLSDGSKIWLTNGSKLFYPETFDGNIREVTLEGEAFFTVAKDEQKPFLVMAGEHRVRVLGTEFSILAYPGDDILQVDLVSGKVEMDVLSGDGKYTSYSLKPSYSLILDKTSKKLTQSKITDSFFNYWQKGIYAFTNERFADLAIKIERIYGVEIIFEDEKLKERTFTGTFGVDDNIYTMMEVFKRASARSFEYRIDKKRIYIK